MERRSALRNKAAQDDVITGAQELGVNLDAHISFVIAAMQARSADLGLSGSYRFTVR